MKDIHHYLDQLDNRLDNYMSDWDMEASCETGRNDDPWNRWEILYHLFLTERKTLDYLNKKIEDDAVTTSRSWWSWIRSLILQKWMKSSRKARSPQMVDPRVQPTPASPKALLNDYESLRKEWRSFVNDRPDAYWTNDIFRHPYAGRINGVQMMKFLLAHFDRHHAQMRSRINNKTSQR